jgi:raffinose/stachyose/melibiose transport system permease protein
VYNEKGLNEKAKVFFSLGFLPLLAFALVVLLPFLFGLFVTFTNWSGTQNTITFVGLKNYIAAFTDKAFWASMGITFKYMIWVLVLTNVLALVLALLVTSGFKGQNGFRAAFFTPNLIGGVVLGFIWQFVFSQVLVNFGEASGIALFSATILLSLVTAWRLSC